jgi:hypothetical protein
VRSLSVASTFSVNVLLETLISPFFLFHLYIPDEYSFGDVTRKVVSSFAEDAKITGKTPQGLASSKELDDALEKWDGLSEEQLNDGLDKLNQYVELVAKEESDKEKNKKK